MKIGLVFPGFAAHEHDWCLPAHLDFVRALARHVGVHVFTLRWPERGGCYSVFGAQVHAMNGRKRLSVRAPLLWARSLAAIVAEHRRAPFTLLHAACADEPALVAVLAGRWLRIPVVVSVTGGELMALRDIEYGLQILPGRQQLARFVLTRADVVTAGSAYLQDSVETFLKSEASRVVRAPFGVDRIRFSASGLADEATCGPVLAVGSLTKVKNHALALEAIGLTDAPLLVAGDGPLRTSLERAVSTSDLASRVQWLGAVAHDIMPALYRSSGLLLHTSRHEAQGLVLLEAAASGIPVTGTAVGVLPEIVPAGWMLPSPDGGRETARLLADHVSELRGSVRVRRQHVDHARALVDGQFSLSHAVDRFLQVYASTTAISAPTVAHRSATTHRAAPSAPRPPAT